MYIRSVVSYGEGEFVEQACLLAVELVGSIEEEGHLLLHPTALPIILK
jgi:hypothetical protein